MSEQRLTDEQVARYGDYGLRHSQMMEADMIKALATDLQAARLKLDEQEMLLTEARHWTERSEISHQIDIEAARREIADLRAEVAKWKRIRTPAHGPCCTCQACGLHYDECRCSLDDVADEVSTLRAGLRELYSDDDMPYGRLRQKIQALLAGERTGTREG